MLYSFWQKVKLLRSSDWLHYAMAVTDCLSIWKVFSTKHQQSLSKPAMHQVWNKPRPSTGRLETLRWSGSFNLRFSSGPVFSETINQQHHFTTVFSILQSPSCPAFSFTRSYWSAWHAATSASCFKRLRWSAGDWGGQLAGPRNTPYQLWPGEAMAFGILPLICKTSWPIVRKLACQTQILNALMKKMPWKWK